MKQLTPRLIMLPIISALLMLVGLPRIGALPAKAATTAVINITTTDDELNTDQDCSLREAIQAANTDTAVDACAAGSGADTINIPAGTYIITIPGTNEDANATGDWDVLSPITLQGAGMGNTVLNGGGLDMVLHGINTDLTIRSLTITNGDGGMLQNGGNLVVESVRIAGNTAISWRAGGATVFNANATMTDSIVEDNHFNATSHWQGGGYAFSATVGGPMLSMRIERSIIRNNTNKSHGGGIFFGTNTGRPMTGLITNSAIVGNKTIGVGGGLMTDDTGTLTVENTTISDNEASIGSAIFADASANSILLRHVTITNNRTTTGYGGYGRFGGGVVTWGSPITFEKSILYGNVDIHSPARPDCYEPVSSRKIISNGYNIIGDIGNCTALTHATDLPVGTNPLLSPLSGAMPVHKLTTGSPAIDYSPSPCLPVDDQVGTTRANGSSTGTKCDVGAWEYGGNTNLALYALAFDNKLNTAGDLSSQYSDTIEGIRLATVGNAKHAVVLADLPGLNNTIVLDIRNGVITPVVGLPDASFALDTSLYEYDMANGQQLGQFLRWAINTYPADKVFFSYIGHGNALVPENDLSNDVDAALATTPAPAGWPAFEEASSGKLAMLPAGHGVNPNLTDYQSKSILSVYDLANALQIGTNNGTTQLDLLDIIHCFAASIEELYALRNYASVTTAGPNYVFFQGEMPGAGLAAMNFSDPADAMASQLLDAYETEIPSTGHPHVLTAVDNSLLEDVKTAWDQTAYYIDQLFTTDPSSTKGNLLTAYQTTGAYYDTTSCQPQDWELAPPDALVDFVPFIDQLHPLLDPLGDNGVSANALLTQARLNAAIITTRKQSGNPWFAPTKTWDFSNHTGIGLFANFEYMQLTTNGSTANYLSWQAPFYNSTTSASNPQPYNFVQDGFAGSTWATVFNNYWDGTPYQTAMCLGKPVGIQEVGELKAERIILPAIGRAAAGAAVQVWGVLSTDRKILGHPLVLLEVLDSSGNVLFSETVAAPAMPTAGTYLIKSTRTWTPGSSGQRFTVRMTVNTDNRVQETNIADNVVNRNDVVVSGTPPTLSASMCNQHQWVDTTNVSLALSGSLSPMRSIAIQWYQHAPSTTNPQFLVPVLRQQTVHKNITLPTSPCLSIPIPTSVLPGVVTMHIWAQSSGGVSVVPQVVRFNYIPANATLAANSQHYFLFNANAGDALSKTLSGAGQMYLWYPNNYAAPNHAVGAGTLSLTAPQTGEYLLAVDNPGSTAITYTLALTRNGTALLSVAQVAQALTDLSGVPTKRPEFAEIEFVQPAATTYNIYLPLSIR